MYLNTTEAAGEGKVQPEEGRLWEGPQEQTLQWQQLVALQNLAVEDAPGPDC